VSRFKRSAGWLLSGTCLIGIVLWARTQPAPRLADGPDGVLWASVVIVAAGLVLVVQCERWLFLLRQRQSTVSRGTAYRSGAIGELGNVLLPMRAGDALRIGVVVERDKASVRTTTGALVVERLLSLACHAILLAFTAAIVLGPGTGTVTDALRVGAILVIAILVTTALGVALVAASSRLSRNRKLQAVAPILAPLATLGRRNATIATGFSAMIWLGEVAMWWAAAHAVGLSLGAIEAAYVLALSSLVLIVPAGPGAVGTLDAAIVLALHSLGEGSGQVIAFVVVLRAATLAPCLATWIVIAWGSLRGRMRAAPAREAQ
jgi:uncharacterized membrane protein YbhN (UPF0104 family)